MREISRPPRGRPSKVRKTVSNRRNNSAVAGGNRALQEHLDQAVARENGEEEDEVEDEDAEADDLDVEKRESIDDDVRLEHDASDHHSHQLQLLAAANSLANGAASGILTSQDTDPSIHPALQALSTHHQPFVMEAPQHQPTHHQPPAPMGVPGEQHVVHAAHAQQQQQQHNASPSSEEVARRSGCNVTADSALAKRLAREPGLRPPTQRREEQVLNLQRRSNVEALLAQISGHVTARPCKNCHKGHGPWTTCVVVDGQMCGSCANCWYNASGARCSFHEVRNPQAAHHPLVMEPSPRFNMPPMAAAAAAQALSQGMMQGGLDASSITFDPQLKYIIESASAAARGAGERELQLMEIEYLSKKLAVAVAKYEKMLRDDEQQQQQQQQEAEVAAGQDATMTEPDDHQ